MCLDLTTTHRQTWLFSCTSTYHSTDLLTARGVVHLVVHGTSGSTSYETIPHVRLESSGGVLSTVDMVVQRRDGPRRLRDDDDDFNVRSKADMSQLNLPHCRFRFRHPSCTMDSPDVVWNAMQPIRLGRGVSLRTTTLQ